MCEAYAGLYLVGSWNSKLASEAGVESTRQTIVRGRPERGVRGRKHIPSRGVCTFGDASHIKYMCMAFPRAVHCCGPGLCTSSLYLGFLFLEKTGAFGEF